MIKKFMIGTAQFGLEYGLTNQKGRVKKNEIIKILKYAKKKKNNFIDTSQAYGVSENNLKLANEKSWKIITKINLSGLKKNQNIDNEIKKKISISMKNLNRKSIYGILLQNSNIIFSKKGPKIYKALTFLKKKGLIKKFGYSIYDFKNIKKICNKLKPDIIQCPFNIFDRRLIENNNLTLLKNNNIEVHVRSIFLQGLLLSLNKKIIYKEFSKNIKLFDLWNKFLKKEKISSLDACVNFVNKNKQIDKIIIGIENLKQLKMICCIKEKNLTFPNNLRASNKHLINPQLW